MTSLAIVGGGGFRVPLIIAALAHRRLPLSQVILLDTDTHRLQTMRRILTAQLQHYRDYSPRIITTTSRDGLGDADIIFVAMRIGGTAGRVLDEQIAMRHGLLGQETIGVGGMAYALRTLGPARDLAGDIARLAPNAWTINFTNPAGIITEAMREILGDRVVGICDTPIGLLRRASTALKLAEPATDFDYLGLNHLGWLYHLRVDGHDLLPSLLADDRALASLEETELLGAELIRTLGVVPNEYLFYYYNHREACAGMARGDSRGVYLHEQQREFYHRCASHPHPYELWNITRQQRDASYMAEARPPADRNGRAAAEIAQGGYHNVAVSLMAALLHDEPATMILNIANIRAGSPLITGLDTQAVVEVGCHVDGRGIHPWALPAPRADHVALMSAIKACDRELLAASATGDHTAALRAFGTHPLVDSWAAARAALRDYQRAHPTLAP